MKHMISVLSIVLALISCLGVAVAGNVITQSNCGMATALISGNIDENAANWAVICGDDNELLQDNWQSAYTCSATVNLSADNVALIIGESNNALQMNDPTSVYVAQVNELLVLGTSNEVNQANNANWGADEGDVEQDQDNFGVVFGADNELNQTNIAYGNNFGPINVTQAEANAAYIYGKLNLIDQANDVRGYADLCSGMINQTAKNLAFAISSNTSVEYISPYSTIMLQPQFNGSAQNMSVAGAPELPSPPSMTIVFPSDP
jgi:hypothetical protein